MVSLWKKLRLALLATIVLHGYGTCAVPVQAALTSSNVPAHTHVSVQQGGVLSSLGTVNVTGTLSSTKACASGYTRMSPNFCSNNTRPFTALTRDACTTVARPAAGATGALIFAFAQVTGSGAIGQTRSASVYAFTANTCATVLRDIVSTQSFEFSTASGSIMSSDYGTSFVPYDGSGNLYLRLSDDAANTGASSYGVQGYFD
jgi:hypothetical protein